jgi:hypothetical protein
MRNNDGRHDNQSVLEPSITWDYQRIYDRLASYVLEDEPVRASRLFDALQTREGGDVKTGLSGREWDWLQYNLGFMKRVVETPLLAAMVYLCHKSQTGSFYPSKIARQTGYHEPQICRKAKELESKGLLKRYCARDDRRAYYVASRDFPVLNRIIVDLILARHDIEALERLLTYNEEKRLKYMKYRRTHAEANRRWRRRRTRRQHPR